MKLQVIDFGHNGDLPASVRAKLPDDTLQTVFRQALNSALREGKSEMHAFLRAWAALADLGYAEDDNGEWKTEKAEADPTAPASNKCAMYDGYPVNAGLKCTSWESDGSVAKYVPPAEVRAAAKASMDAGVVSALTEVLANGSGLNADDVRAVHAATAAEATDAWGGPHGAKWSSRVIRKLDVMEANAPADVELSGRIVKVDEAQHLVFGWFSIVSIGGRPVEDVQGDIITPETLEVAAYDYVLEARVGGEMHEDGDDGSIQIRGRLIESVVFTEDKVSAMVSSLAAQGIASTIDLGCVPWWGGMKIDDMGTWGRVTSGELKAWSIGGKGKREKVEKYSEDQPRAANGEFGEGGSGGKDPVAFKASERVQRAMAAMNYCGAEKQRIADEQERKISDAIGLPRTKDNSAFDLRNSKVGVEVKTMIDSKNGKITMSKSALARKVEESTRDNIKTYTVVADKRGGNTQYYISDKMGSLRVGSMTPTTLSQIKSIVHGKVK